MTPLKLTTVSTAALLTIGLSGCTTVRDINDRVFNRSVEVVEKDVTSDVTMQDASSTVATGSSSTYSSATQGAIATNVAKVQMAEPANNNATFNANAGSSSQVAAIGSSGDMPPNAKPGECYARVFNPPKYADKTETVLKTPATERIDVIPAKYQTVQEQVLVQEAGTEVQTIPAKYEWRNEQVLVSPATEELVTVPAKYDNVTERVLVRAAYQSWKKGRGPIEKVDNATGEIMCLVEVPAEYKTVSRSVLVSPATTRSVTKPAEYRTVRKRVQVEPAQTREIPIPAKYDTIPVRKQVQPAQERRIPVPAEYQTVTKRIAVSGGAVEWRSILCETNTSKDIIARIQRALSGRGYNPGKIDGQLGDDTMRAVGRFQRDNRVAEGELTMETLKLLGVAG